MAGSSSPTEHDSLIDSTTKHASIDHCGREISCRRGVEGVAARWNF